MLNALEFAMVSCLFADMAYNKLAVIWSWLKGVEQKVVDEVKKM